MQKFHVTIAEGIEALQKNAQQPFAQLLQNKSMSIEYFAPKNIDTQQPHAQDEIYVIASGNSSFYRNGETIDCKTGDVIFVPAGMEHRFVNFSEDFATWVIFY
jgi:mannose-6-phosphate isomerase-like protein (cupin superfamily)